MAYTRRQQQSERTCPSPPNIIKCPPMDRTLEPEIMSSPAEAQAYAQADFADSNQAYADGFTAEYPDHLTNILDLGCGPADVTVRIARIARQARITAVDGSAAMLAFARSAIDAARVCDRAAPVLWKPNRPRKLPSEQPEAR